MNFRDAELEDKEFILNANKEINILSGLNDSTLESRIDKDMFEDKTCKSIIAEIDGKVVGMVLYSYVYWANCGKGIYLSQAYVKSEYRGNKLQRLICEELEKIARKDDIEILSATASPYNEFSVNTFMNLGYEIKKDKLKYGGLRRYVLVKEL